MVVAGASAGATQTFSVVGASGGSFSIYTDPFGALPELPFNASAAAVAAAVALVAGGAQARNI